MSDDIEPFLHHVSGWWQFSIISITYLVSTSLPYHFFPAKARTRLNRPKYRTATTHELKRVIELRRWTAIRKRNWIQDYILVVPNTEKALKTKKAACKKVAWDISGRHIGFETQRPHMSKVWCSTPTEATVPTVKREIYASGFFLQAAYLYTNKLSLVNFPAMLNGLLLQNNSLMPSIRTFSSHP